MLELGGAVNPRVWLRGEPRCTEVAKHQAGNSAREWMETALEGIVDPGLGTAYECGS